MRNHPATLREQQRIRTLSIAAIIAAAGLTGLSLIGLPSQSDWSRSLPIPVQTDR